MKTSSSSLALLLCCLLAPAAPAQARRSHDRPAARGAAKPSADLILRNANSNEFQMQGGELVTTFAGNVIFDYGDLTIRADNACSWKNQGIVKLTSNVRAVRDSATLACDQMTFYKKRRLVEAVGHTDYRNPRDNIHLTGQHATYALDRKTLVVSGQPRLCQFDTAAAETLIITGQEMVYQDSLSKATVKRNVIITRGDLTARSEQACWWTRLERAQLRGSPRITYQDHAMDGDSVDLFFRGDTLHGMSVWGRAHALYREREEADTSATNVWGDSMYLAMTRAGDPDSAWAWRNVVSVYTVGSENDSVNRVSGKAMVLDMEEKGGLKSALVWGNAASTYLVREKGDSGRNEASGDSIRVSFTGGRAATLTLTGSVRGAYYPDKR